MMMLRVIVAWLVLCISAGAQVGQMPAPAQLMPAPAAGYVGPGDVSGTAAYAFWGTMAYTAASIGTNAIRVQRRGDNAQQDFATQANGYVDSAAITTFITGGGNTRGDVITIYDQTGNGRHQTAGVLFSPEIIATGQGGFAILRTPGTFGNGPQTKVTGMTVAQPFTITFAGKRTANFTSQQYAYGDVVTADIEGGWNNAADVAFMRAGTTRTAADAQDNGTTSDYHAFAHIYNNAGTSRFYVGTTSNAIASPGATTISSGMSFGFMQTNGQGDMTGDLSYMAIWASDLGPGGSGTASAINAKVCSNLGFSC